MNNEIRLQYLQAMGIDVWISREKVGQKIDSNFLSTQSVDKKLELQPVSLEIKDAVIPEVYPDENGNDELALSECLQDSAEEDSVDHWAILQKQVKACQQCDLHKTRTQTVFGSGNLNADWMFVGEAPGKDEDAIGQPFVGIAGKLLTEMIGAIGLERDAVYIANILKCSPPNNGNPKVEEISSCHNYLQQQIDLVKPKIVLAVGRIAAQTLLESKEPLTKLRGVTHTVSGIPLIVVYHPAYLLRSLLEKRKAWQDLQLAINIYQKLK